MLNTSSQNDLKSFSVRLWKRNFTRCNQNAVETCRVSSEVTPLPEAHIRNHRILYTQVSSSTLTNTLRLEKLEVWTTCTTLYRYKQLQAATKLPHLLGVGADYADRV